MKYLILILLQIIAGTSLKSQSLDEVGVIEIRISQIEAELNINNVDLLSFIGEFEDVKQLNRFGEIKSSSTEESILGSNETFIFSNLTVKVSNLLPHPQITQLITQNVSNPLVVSDLILRVGLHVDDLSSGFQDFAKKYGVLPKYGSSSLKKKYTIPESDTVVRIYYDLDSKIIEEVALINSPM